LIARFQQHDFHVQGGLVVTVRQPHAIPVVQRSPSLRRVGLRDFFAGEIPLTGRTGKQRDPRRVRRLPFRSVSFTVSPLSLVEILAQCADS
jgi:hypothetical protein